MSKLLNTTFRSGADDGLVTKDVHEVKDTSVIQKAGYSNADLTSRISRGVVVPTGDIKVDGSGGKGGGGGSSSSGGGSNSANDWGDGYSKANGVRSAVKLSDSKDWLGRTILKDGVTTEYLPADPNVPTPKILKDSGFEGVTVEDIQKEINGLPPEFSSLLKGGLGNATQQELLMGGTGLLNKYSSKLDFTGHINSWVSANGVDLNRNCALLAGLAALLGGRNVQGMALFLVLLALLSKLIECFINDF